MKISTKLKRLLNLHKLLWVDDRVSDLEATLLSVRTSLDALDAMRSSLETPPHLLEEFYQWKVSNPVPERPLVSVCVATHNRPHLLTKRCIPSVLDQTYGNLELIIVGDGCTDQTEEMVSGIKDSRLRFVNMPERESYPSDPQRRWMVAGTEAMNEALSMTRGHYVTHLDDDDEYLPERLEKLVQFANKNKCDFVWHPFWIDDGTGHRALNKALYLLYGQVTTSSVFYRSWFTSIKFDSSSHLQLEPGDWNWVRRIKYFKPVSMRYPEPLHIKYES